jgi:hypothetical protein
VATVSARAEWCLGTTSSNTNAIERGPEDALRTLVERVVSFVESEEYVEVAKRGGRL